MHSRQIAGTSQTSMQSLPEIDPDIELGFEIKQTMHDLKAKGYWLHPLGGCDNGKKQIAKPYAHPMPLLAVWDRMVCSGREIYGIRCHDIVVVDLDKLDPDTLSYAKDRFGVTDYKVRTHKGEHWYYQQWDDLPGEASIRVGNVAIDVKHGDNSYVVGPGSRRPDNGAVYTLIGDPLPTPDQLPPFRDHFQHEPTPKQPVLEQARPLTTAGASDRTVVISMKGGGVPVGQRHPYLMKMAAKWAKDASSNDALEQALTKHAHACFQTMEDFPQSEIAGVAKAAWGYRQDNQLWGGNFSAVPVATHEYEALEKTGNGADACFLCIRLRQKHGAKPGYVFKLALSSMTRDRVIESWGIDRYRAAIKALVEAGMLEEVRKPRRKAAGQYRLKRLPVP